MKACKLNHAFAGHRSIDPGESQSDVGPAVGQGVVSKKQSPSLAFYPLAFALLLQAVWLMCKMDLVADATVPSRAILVFLIKIDARSNR